MLRREPSCKSDRWEAAHFFWDGQRKGMDIALAIPALEHAHARLDKMNSAAITIRMALADFRART